MDREEEKSKMIRLANDDLRIANHGLSLYPKPLEVICYHCQQSSEKYLKAYLIEKGEKIPKTHDLVLLNNRCEEYDQSFNEIYDECKRLIPYGVEVRYPLKVDIEEHDMKLALKNAEKIQTFITARLGLEKEQIKDKNDNHSFKSTIDWHLNNDKKSKDTNRER